MIGKIVFIGQAAIKGTGAAGKIRRDADCRVGRPDHPPDCPFRRGELQLGMRVDAVLMLVAGRAAIMKKDAKNDLVKFWRAKTPGGLRGSREGQRHEYKNYGDKRGAEYTALRDDLPARLRHIKNFKSLSLPRNGLQTL